MRTHSTSKRFQRFSKLFAVTWCAFWRLIPLASFEVELFLVNNFFCRSRHKDVLFRAPLFGSCNSKFVGPPNTCKVSRDQAMVLSNPPSRCRRAAYLTPCPCLSSGHTLRSQLRLGRSLQVAPPSWSRNPQRLGHHHLSWSQSRLVNSLRTFIVVGSIVTSAGGPSRIPHRSIPHHRRAPPWWGLKLMLEPSFASAVVVGIGLASVVGS